MSSWHRIQPRVRQSSPREFRTDNLVVLGWLGRDRNGRPRSLLGRAMCQKVEGCEVWHPDRGHKFLPTEIKTLYFFTPHLVRAYSHAQTIARLRCLSSCVPDPERLRHLGLTCRESEVLHWLIQGKRNAEIGTILGTSAKTITKHLERAFYKLGVETRTAATLVAIERTRAS
jgi:DNA-binding CsgD family transcriptional regulator